MGCVGGSPHGLVGGKGRSSFNKWFPMVTSDQIGDKDDGKRGIAA